jgi:hypothetical protein
MTYLPFLDESSQPYGSFEVFEVQPYDEHSTQFEPGWYWHACFPGCLADGEPSGPFDSEHDAIEDARK